MENLQEHLKEHSLNIDTIPYVLQLNKRDLPNVLSVEELKKQLQKKGEPVIEGVAINGTGVFDTLKEFGKMVLAELKKVVERRTSSKRALFPPGLQSQCKQTFPELKNRVPLKRINFVVYFPPIIWRKAIPTKNRTWRLLRIRRWG